MASFFNEYIYYNDVKVRLFCTDGPVDEYVISNINTKSIPGPNCGAHLQSVSITPPNIVSDKQDVLGIRQNYCATGTVTIIDYRHAVFNRLTSYMKYVTDHSSESLYITPSICIEVKCYSGIEVYDGFVKNYKFTFQGTAPTITLEWTSIPQRSLGETPSNGDDSKTPSPFQTYYTIDGFLTSVKSAANGSNLPVIKFKKDGEIKTINSGAELDKDLRFINDSTDASKESSATYDVRKLNASTGSPMHDALLWLASNVVTKGDVVDASTGKTITDEDKEKKTTTKVLRRPLAGTFQKDGSFLLEVIEDPLNPSNEKNQSTEAASSIVFVQNGKFAPYTKVSFDKLPGVNFIADFKNTPLGERIVIPMSSISFETNFKSLVLQYDILNGANYTTVTVNGSGQASGAPTGGEANAQTAATAENNNNSNTNISFTCYNIMSFSVNCPSARIAFIVYDEYGDIHPMSGYGTVTAVTYDISGAVVSANVTVTKVFNNVSVTDTTEGKVPSEDNSQDRASGN